MLGAVNKYDFYVFVAGKKVVCGWHSFEAATDDAALKIASDLLPSLPAELWQESTLIKRWESPCVSARSSVQDGAEDNLAG